MHFNISYYGLDKFYKQHKETIIQLIDEALKDGQFLEGTDVKEFELKLAKYCNRKYAITVSSCSDALYFSLLSLGITTNDEVLLPSFSFIATLNAVLRVGAIPVFYDINETDLSINIEEFKIKRTAKTKAIIVVPLYGFSHDYSEIEQWCENENIFLIEDAAQAIGSSFNNKPSGSWGDVSCFSFDPSKIIHAFGTGGAILTNSEKLYLKFKTLRYQGKNLDDFVDKGYNSRISSIQAKLLTWQLNQIQHIITKRVNIAQYYKQYLSCVNNISFPTIDTKVQATYHKFVIFCSKRDELKSYLSKNGIQTQIHYPKLLYEYSLLKNYPFKAKQINQAYKLSKKVLSLPLYAELTNKEIEWICETIKKFYK